MTTALAILMSASAVGCQVHPDAHAGTPTAAPALTTEFTCDEPTTWSAWIDYTTRFVASDGRIIDRTDGDRSTSEGQAYALFHSLVANDRARFEAILGWTENNLAEGDLNQTLPGWLWGKKDDGTWGVIDANPAADADLWLAYTLLEASDLWDVARYRALGRSVLSQIVEREVVSVEGLGPVLIPAPYGFELEDGRWRLNPSYTPVQITTALAARGEAGPWKEVTQNTVALIRRASRNGFVPDWVIVDESGKVLPDEISPAQSGYESIRVYLWWGLMDDKSPHKRAMRSAVSGPVKHWEKEGFVPEITRLKGPISHAGDAPPGFHHALLSAIENTNARESFLERYASKLLPGTPAQNAQLSYYDFNLILFGQGAEDGRYRFDSEGHLNTPWQSICEEKR